MSDPFDPYKEWLEIEPHEQPVDHYRLLGVNRFESQPHVISVAADQRMSHIRNFQTGPRGKYTQRLLNEIAIARRTLIDDEKRAEYDSRLRDDSSPDIDIDAQLPPAVNFNSASASASAPTADLTTAIGQTEGPPSASTSTVELPASLLPQAVAPAEPSSPPVSAAARSAPPPTSVIRGRRKRSSGLPMLALATLGVAVVAAAVWAVGTYWSGGKERSDPTAAKPKPIKKKGLKRKVTGKRPAVEIEQEVGDFSLSATIAGLHGPNIRLEDRGKYDVLCDWKSKDDWANWRFKVVQPGVFQLRINYLVPEGGGGTYEVVLDGQRIKETTTRGGAAGFITDEMHLALRRKGSHVLMIRPTKALSGELMVLRSLKLTARTTAR